MQSENKPENEPYNNDAEQGVLGCLLTRNSCFDDLAHILKAEHFYVPVHGEIFTAISKAIKSGKTASPVTLKTEFGNHPDLEELGGGVYLAELAAAVVSAINAKDYAETIKELATRRSLIMDLQAVIDLARNSSALDRGAVLEAANKSVNTLIDDMPSREYIARDAIAESLAFTRGLKDGSLKPITTGISKLDKALNGLFGGFLYVIAGRPGMGKTALALNVADNAARASGISTTVFSFEMSASQLSTRLLARESGVSTMDQLSTSPLSKKEWDDLAYAENFYRKAPLYIEDAAGATLSVIISKARKIRRVRGKFVLVIDYLQLIQSESRGQMQMVHQIAEITRGLKCLAKELDIPVILLSQLSRDVEKREDKRPLKSDLRDSGAIEQDADAIIFPYRHEYYLSRQEPIQREGEGEGQYQNRHFEWESKLANSRGKADLIIAKWRYGLETSIPVTFDGVRQLFHCDE